ncbi:unnamed protein product [Zymoseptoria tritici ST99CH_1A5]|uniref:Uncharacterized protein n=2 Tax=Zymoseptoria tritici TaxID=1047171 RepID=A0A2H1GCI7_ZYMTR|nr:unnamed protein product [Zymoseptoria tritici ST99CH_1E4]SMY23970.1 unnamed protein product [Zymoseptoria tritici ST99CH_1A5]
MNSSCDVTALAMAIPTSAVLNCGGFCDCLHTAGSHCCVDTTYGAEGNGGFATKSGDDCAARRGAPSARPTTIMERNIVAAAAGPLSGQLRCEWTHGDGGREAETKVKPVGRVWPQIE